MAVENKYQPQFTSQIDFGRTQQELDAEWEKYVIKGLEPRRVSPVILGSWRRCRELYHVDPYLEAPPVLLSKTDVQARCEQNEVLPLARPVLEELTYILNDTGCLISFFDAEGWLLEVSGDRRLLKTVPGNFNVKEEFVGTTSGGLALVERRPIEVMTSEYYLLANRHPFSGCAVPILNTMGHEAAGIISVRGYKRAMPSQTLLTIWMAAQKIEQKLRHVQMAKEQHVINDYLKMTARQVSDGLLCLDHHGRVLHINPAASRIFGVSETINVLDACPDLKQILFLLVHRPNPSAGPEEHKVYCPRTDRYLNVVTFPVIREGRTIGAIALIPSLDARSGQRVSDNFDGNVARRTRSNRARAKYTFKHILGKVAEIKQALDLAKLAATNLLPVVITGESGTGKEMFAHAIHNDSPRARLPFVVVNCGAIPHELIEAELFGYEAGAFTGAKPGGSAGTFENANGGTIFLDEVNELSLSAQVALLRVLQEMEVVRLGSSSPTAIDVRVIAASNQDLRQEVKARRFRCDLYYRLNVMGIELPPLRQRLQDIPLLVDYMLQRVAKECGQQQISLDQGVIEALLAYDWPGNIRELKNVIQRAAVLSQGSMIRLNDLPPEIRATKVERDFGESQFAWSPLDNQERELLLKTLHECSGNVTEAARQLVLSRVTLHRKMKKHSISRHDFLGTKLSADNGVTKTKH